MTYLHPTAELASRVVLVDDPGRALALAQVLCDPTPLMFNHARGLWGYSGTGLDGAPLTVQATGIGGPSAAILGGELGARGARGPGVLGRPSGWVSWRRWARGSSYSWAACRAPRGSWWSRPPCAPTGPAGRWARASA